MSNKGKGYHPVHWRGVALVKQSDQQKVVHVVEGATGNQVFTRVLEILSVGGSSLWSNQLVNLHISIQHGAWPGPARCVSETEVEEQCVYVEMEPVEGSPYREYGSSIVTIPSAPSTQ